MSNTVHVTSPAHFSQLLQSSRILVVDFYADWCGPCKTIAPIYEQLSAQLSRPRAITFAKVDTDAQKDIASTYNVSAMPTFLIFKAQREIKRIRGADAKGLNDAVKQLAREAESADESGAAGVAAGGGAGGEAWSGGPAPRGYSDVTDQVDVLGLDFLNLDGGMGGTRTVFSSERPSGLDAKGKSAAAGKKDWIESDTDEQLMLFIPFQSALKLHSMQITSIPQTAGRDDEAPTRPKTLHVYSNRSHVLGFDEAEGTPATQTVEIKASDWDSKTHTARVELRFVKFQNISSVTIFVSDGDGDAEKTRIDRVRLYGESGEKRAMGKLEKIGDEQGE